MKVFVLRYGNNVLGVYSTEKEVEEAEEFYSNLKIFEQLEYDYFSASEFQINYFSEDVFRSIFPKEELVKKNKFKDFIQSTTIYSTLAIFIVIIVLGSKSCVNIVFGLLKH